MNNEILDDNQFYDVSGFDLVKINVIEGVQEKVYDGVNEYRDSKTKISESRTSEVDIDDLYSDHEKEDLDKDKILELIYIWLET